MIRWVAFDLGDVVLTRTAALPELASMLSAPSAAVGTAYRQHRRCYDRTSDAAGFWSAVAAAAGAPAPTRHRINELVRVDDAGWSIPNADVLQLAAELRAAGAALAVLSNAPASMGRLIRQAPWARMFHPLLFSGELGMLKPEPEIYRHALAALAAGPGDVAFLDDRPENVQGALDLGVRAILFTGAAQARSDLRGLGVRI